VLDRGLFNDQRTHKESPLLSVWDVPD